MNSNTRIAKNTILLYIRMLISLGISLYTSRVILSILGEDDFGIYNVVGGVVVLFSFLTNAMTNSTQRFLNFNLGLKEESKLLNVFNTSMVAHLIIMAVVLILAETVGLWFVNTQLNIPEERHHAALWIYHTSVLITLLNIIVTPYRASIIATEKMGVFALISIIDIILKLLIVLILPYFETDSLILYSVLLVTISLLNFIIYRYICRKQLSFTHFHFIWDKPQLIEQMSFSGWSLFGGVALVGAKQGSNILINTFFNVAVNAAVGVANQVRNAIFGFVTSFQMAFKPQIVKLYASNEEDKLLDLIYRSSKFSFYLLFVLTLPIIIYCKEILSLWLVNVPEYAVVFTQLVLITAFTEALSAPLWTAIGATGYVKRYQIFVSTIILLDLPIVYIFFKLGFNPIWAFIINLMISVIAYIYRLLYIRNYVNYKLRDYLKLVIYPCLLISIISIPLPMILSQFCTSTISIIASICCTVLITCCLIYLFGLNRKEKDFIVQNVLKKFINK